jgi:hypothetical protein
MDLEMQTPAVRNQSTAYNTQGNKSATKTSLLDGKLGKVVSFLSVHWEAMFGCDVLVVSV